MERNENAALVQKSLDSLKAVDADRTKRKEQVRSERMRVIMETSALSQLGERGKAAEILNQEKERTQREAEALQDHLENIQRMLDAVEGK